MFLINNKIYVIRLSKITLVAAMAFYATLVVIGNLFDFNSNLEFVRHVLAMDSIFPNSKIMYRAIKNEVVVYSFYFFIIFLEAITAVLCWMGAFALLRSFRAPDNTFQKSKGIAIAGLTIGFLTWQVCFMSIGGEWFAMWQSGTWNGLQASFRIFVMFISILVYLTMENDNVE